MSFLDVPWGQAVRTLLDLGASPSVRDAKGLTPLYNAVVMRASPMICQALLHDYSTHGIQDAQGWHEVHQVRLDSLLQRDQETFSRIVGGSQCLFFVWNDQIRWVRLCAGVSERSGAAPGESALLRCRHERAERVGQHAAARLRRRQRGGLRPAAALPRRRPPGAQLRQPDALSGSLFFLSSAASVALLVYRGVASLCPSSWNVKRRFFCAPPFSLWTTLFHILKDIYIYNLLLFVLNAASNKKKNKKHIYRAWFNGLLQLRDSRNWVVFYFTTNDCMASKVSMFDVRKCSGEASSGGVEGNLFFKLFDELDVSSSRRESARCSLGSCDLNRYSIRRLTDFYGTRIFVIILLILV